MTKANNTAAKSEEKHPASASKPEAKHTVKAIETPFSVEEYHKKALVKLFYCQGTNVELNYKELSNEIGVGEKTKAWQCVAWKDLKTNAYIVPSSTKGKLKLSEKGVELAKTFLSDEELADLKEPGNNEEHHAKLKANMVRREKKAERLGPKILDYMIETNGQEMTKHKIAEHFNTLADSHSFFYGFRELTRMELIIPTGASQKLAKKPEGSEEEDESGKKKSKKSKSGGKLWKLSDKAFLQTAEKSVAQEQQD